jgi:hypothetical protein
VFAAAATEDDSDAQLAIRHGGTLLPVIRRLWRCCHDALSKVVSPGNASASSDRVLGAA